MSDVQGREGSPFTHAPKDWAENGVPYGAFCKCSECGYVGTSTVAFDYYTRKDVGAGHLLVCGQCLGYSVRGVERHLRREAVAAFEEDLKKA